MGLGESGLVSRAPEFEATLQATLHSRSIKYHLFRVTPRTFYVDSRWGNCFAMGLPDLVDRVCVSISLLSQVLSNQCLDLPL
jgi:hypothetical protein